MPSSNNQLIVSRTTYVNLERWGKIHHQDVHSTAETIIKKYLKHEDFYQELRQDLSFYLNPFKVKIYRCLNIAGANMGLIARKTGLTYARVKAHIEQLKLAGVVIETNYGNSNIRFFTLNRESTLTRKILKILNLWYEP